MMRSAVLLGICAALSGAWTTQAATVDLVANAWPDERVAPGDTLFASEARQRDSLAAVTCIQNWHEREGFVPMASRLSLFGAREVLRFGRWNGPDLMLVWEASVGVYPDSVRVWDGDGPRGGRLRGKETPQPFRATGLCRRARTPHGLTHSGY